MRLAVVLALAALFASCAAGADGDPCEGASDCESGQICQAGDCVTQCTSHDDCTDQRVCVDGLCARAPGCVDTSDCETGWVCEQRRCVPQLEECSRDSDCPRLHVCRDGACFPRDGADAGDVECFTPGDCVPGESCVNNVCVSGDAGSGADASTDPVTPGPDADPECTLASDCGSGETCRDGSCVPVLDAGGGDDGGTDDCMGREDGRYGEACGAAAECCNGMCVGNPETGSGFCSKECASYSDCNPLGVPGEFFCTEVSGSTTRLCGVSDYGDACAVPEDCIGQTCLVATTGRSCTWRCGRTSDCPPGSVCGLVAFAGDQLLDVCTPIGSSCSSPTGSDCLSGTCLTDDVGGSGVCTTFCEASDPQACPPGWACSEVDASLPPGCVPG